jgi:hypothetical protein
MTSPASVEGLVERLNSEADFEDEHHTVRAVLREAAEALTASLSEIARLEGEVQDDLEEFTEALDHCGLAERFKGWRAGDVIEALCDEVTRAEARALEAERDNRCLTAERDAALRLSSLTSSADEVQALAENEAARVRAEEALKAIRNLAQDGRRTASLPAIARLANAALSQHPQGRGSHE